MKFTGQDAPIACATLRLNFAHQDWEGVLQECRACFDTDLVVVWNAQQLPEVRLSLVQDGGELFAAMAELHHADATALPVQ